MYFIIGVKTTTDAAGSGGDSSPDDDSDDEDDRAAVTEVKHDEVSCLRYPKTTFCNTTKLTTIFAYTLSQVGFTLLKIDHLTALWCSQFFYLLSFITKILKKIILFFLI